MRTSEKALLLLNTGFAVSALALMAFLPSSQAFYLDNFVKVLLYVALIVFFLLYVKFRANKGAAVVLTVLLGVLFIVCVVIFAQAYGFYKLESAGKWQTALQ
ncbi:MAG: hypothetical protein ACOYJB_08840 [Christensenellaceae bacterium]